MISDNADKLRPWRDTVAWNVRDAMACAALPGPLAGPLEVRATFVLPRPPSAPKSRWAPEKKPDLDKLLRALLDACTTAGAWIDDAQVVTVTASKVYATETLPPQVLFTVSHALPERSAA
jgi:crossover junction endodeoxyribonuclease RusA